MKDFLSHQRTSILALAACIFVVWLTFILYGFRWTALLGVTLAFLAAYGVAIHATRSITNVIDDIEGEAATVTARPAPRAPRAPR